MKPILTSIAFVTFLIIGSVNPSLAQTPEQLYQKGLTKEEGRRCSSGCNKSRYPGCR